MAQPKSAGSSEAKGPPGALTDSKSETEPMMIACGKRRAASDACWENRKIRSVAQAGSKRTQVAPQRPRLNGL